jgi:two-component system, chemotaxis family, CheB/CheR fusion protein
MEQKHSVEPLLRHNIEPGEMTTVFVVDDDRAIRELIRDLLQENGYTVEIYADSAAFLAAYRPRRAGCLLVDALMPGMTGIQLIEHLKRDRQELPAIVITGHASVPMTVQAMKAGAIDFIEKPVRCDELLDMIKRAFDQTRDTAALSVSRNTAATRVANLTTCQRQVLDLVLAGHRSRDIAAVLGISPRTVDNHRAAIMRKTGSESLPALFHTCVSISGSWRPTRIPRC